MLNQGKTAEELQSEVDELRAQLEEARETLRAIREGDVDALVVSTPEGERIFTLEGADQAYRTIIEQMQETAVTLVQDGGIRYCNRWFAGLLGLPLEQVIGTPFEDHVTEADRARLDELFQEAQAGSARGEVSLEEASGRRISAMLGLSSVMVNGASSICVVVIDLTERKRAEQILASEQFIRRLIDNAPMGVAVVGRDLRYVLANPAYRAVAADSGGCTSVVGRTIAEVFPPAVAGIVEPFVRQVLESGKPLEVDEYEAPVRGRTWWDVSEIPLHDAAGQVEAVLILTNEVTQRKQAEEQLAAAKTAAESANAAKDHFLATLSHELRTPLTPVLMLSQQLETEPLLSEEFRDDMKTIRQNIQLEARLIDDLLDLTRIARGKIELKPQPVDVHELIQHAMQTCSDEHFESRRLKVEWRLLAGLSVVSADPARLEQVFWNLLHNAIKFTPTGGTITIRTANVDGGRISVQVSDTGKGIERDKLTAIFSPFEQGGTATTRRYGGLGLGLAIAKKITELHGGTITADSQGPGQGATFRVELPVADRQPLVREPSLAPSGRRDQDSGIARILLVEDHPPTAAVLERLIRRWGWEVARAGSVKSALDLAAKQAFDLVISDLGLPDGSGHDLMRQLRDAHGLKGIALSGYGMEGDVERSLASGFFVHLVKPLNFDELRNVVMAFLAQAAKDGGRV